MEDEDAEAKMMAAARAFAEEDEHGASKPLIHHKHQEAKLIEQFQPLKRKIAHFKVSSALRPQQAVEVSLDRARQ